MIGTGVSIFLLWNGRIAGVSGIVWSLFRADPQKLKLERILFLLGMMLVPFVFVLKNGRPDYEITENVGLLLVAGLLVGFGARAANGCVAGHGVCGMSRFSRRSIYAVLIFMATGSFSSTVVRVVGL